MSYWRRRIHRLTLKHKIFIILLIFFIILVILDCKIRPLVKSMACNRAKIISVNLINEAILEELNKLDINYSDIILIDKDQIGKVISVNTDMKTVNNLKSSITLAVQDKMTSIKKKDFGISLGTLSGMEIFNGRGPQIPLKVNLNGSVLTELRSNFESGGINQTKHQLYLDINTQVRAFVPGYPVNSTVSASVLIAETVLLGDVPSFFSGVS